MSEINEKVLRVLRASRLPSPESKKTVSQNDRTECESTGKYLDCFVTRLRKLFRMR